MRAWREHALMRHRFWPFTFQREIFECITCMTEVLDDPGIAFRLIDHAIRIIASIAARPVRAGLPEGRQSSDHCASNWPSEQMLEYGHDGRAQRRRLSVCGDRVADARAH